MSIKNLMASAAVALAATVASVGEASARFHCSPEGTVTNSRGITGRDFAGALAAGEPGVVHCHGKDIPVNGNNDTTYVGVTPLAPKKACVVVQGQKYCK